MSSVKVRVLAHTSSYLIVLSRKLSKVSKRTKNASIIKYLKYENLIKALF